MVYQTSINAPRQKNQAIVKQAAAKAGIDMELKSVTASVYFSSDVANPDTYTHFYTDIQMYTTTMTQPDPELFMNQFTSWEVASKENKWQGRNITRWKNEEYDKLYRAAETELDPVKRAALFIKMNELVIQNVVVIPVVFRPRVAAIANTHARRAERLGLRLLEPPQLVPRGLGRHRGTGPAGPVPTPAAPTMSKYFLRRLLISIPALLGISLVLFTVLALAPGDPFEELATNPNVPAEVRANLRTQFGLDDPIPVRYVRWVTRHGQGRLGLLLREPRQRVHAHHAAPADDALRARHGPAPRRSWSRFPIGVYSAVRPYSIFDQIATTFAFIGFSLPTFFTGLLFILFFSIYLDWLPFIYRADISATGLALGVGDGAAGHHADRGARPLPGRRR